MKKINKWNGIMGAVGAALCTLSAARAVSPFVEFGGGSASFTSSANPQYKSGLNFPLALGATLTPPALLQIHAALHTRSLFTKKTDTALGTSESFPIVSVYPQLNVDLWILNVGAGYSPLIFSGSSLNRTSGAHALLVNAAIYLPITPEIDVGGYGARQTFSGSAALPNSSLEFGLGFRLHFGLTQTDVAARRKFKGWRYPFGQWR